MLDSSRTEKEHNMPLTDNSVDFGNSEISPDTYSEEDVELHNTLDGVHCGYRGELKVTEEDYDDGFPQYKEEVTHEANAKSAVKMADNSEFWDF